MKATVAYEASKRRKANKDAVQPLRWHRQGRQGGFHAKGVKGIYRIEQQTPDRRHGVYRWCLLRENHPALLNGKPISADLLSEVKEAAAVYDAMPQGAPVAIVASEASDRYCKAVRAKLVALGSPNPDGDIKHSAQYLQGTERAGIDPGVAAAVIDATMHHAHPPHAQFTLEAHEEAAAREDSAYEERLTKAQRDNLPSSDFALPERRELLIDTAARTRNAPARLEMMHHQHHVSPVEYSQAKRRIAARSKHFGIDSRYAAEEAPTSTEWEVIVTNPPPAHRGAILAMGMGQTEEVGNKIILRGFHDDEQASRTASSIARMYKVQVTFGPRNPLYEAAEEAPKKPLNEFDEHVATELELFADNTEELYRQKEAILANLKKKLEKGTYDSQKAQKLWMYWVDAAAKRYTKEFPGNKWYVAFPPEVRREVARREEEKELAELKIQMGRAKEAPNPLA